MKYLIHLEQGNDEYVFIVGPASWTWIHAPRPAFDEFDNNVTEIVPAAVIAEFDFPVEADALNHTLTLEDAQNELECKVTCGSYENDRVLHLLYSFSREQTQTRPAGEFLGVYEGFVY